MTKQGSGSGFVFFLRQFARIPPAAAGPQHGGPGGVKRRRGAKRERGMSAGDKGQLAGWCALRESTRRPRCCCVLTHSSEPQLRFSAVSIFGLNFGGHCTEFWAAAGSLSITRTYRCTLSTACIRLTWLTHSRANSLLLS